MNIVKYNDKFKGVAGIYGLSKSGKSRLAAAVVRDILSAKKDVLWITSDDKRDTLFKKIYDGVAEPENLGNVFVFQTNGSQITNEIVKDFLYEIFHNEKIDLNNVAMVVYDNIAYGDYCECSSAFSKLCQFCVNHSVVFLYTMQDVAYGTPSIPVYHANCIYKIREIGELVYGDWRLEQTKINYVCGAEQMFVKV